MAAFVNDGGNVWIASDSGGDAVGALRSGRCDDGALFVSRVAVSPALIKTRLKRMQYRPGLLDGFLASTGLDLVPFCNSHD